MLKKLLAKIGLFLQQAVKWLAPATTLQTLFHPLVLSITSFVGRTMRLEHVFHIRHKRYIELYTQSKYTLSTEADFVSKDVVLKLGAVCQLSLLFFKLADFLATTGIHIVGIPFWSAKLDLAIQLRPSTKIS